MSQSSWVSSLYWPFSSHRPTYTVGCPLFQLNGPSNNPSPLPLNFAKLQEGVRFGLFIAHFDLNLRHLSLDWALQQSTHLSLSLTGVHYYLKTTSNDYTLELLGGTQPRTPFVFAPSKLAPSKFAIAKLAPSILATSKFAYCKFAPCRSQPRISIPPSRAL